MNTMSDMNEGDAAVVGGLRIDGSICRRLEDIGLIPGTAVTCIQKSPLGDPVAFRIRGAVIALRREDSSNIFVRAD